MLTKLIQAVDAMRSETQTNASAPP
jgi:hypothetical protein